MGYGQRQLKVGRYCSYMGRRDCKKAVVKWRRLIENKYLRVVMEGFEDAEVPPKPRFIGYW